MATEDRFRYWSCSQNAERSNFTGLGFGPCGGDMIHVTDKILSDGLPCPPFWQCQVHNDQEREDQ